MQNAIVNLNGELLAAEDALVSVYDRGFLYGDSLYEVMRTYQGIFFGIEEHLNRLENSAKLARMTLSQSSAELKKEILKTAVEFKRRNDIRGPPAVDLYCRLIVTRGVGVIGFGLNCIKTPSQFALLVQPVDAPSEASFNQGLHLGIAERLRNDRRALDPAMKSGNYLNSLLAYLEITTPSGGREKGPMPPVQDALLCNSEGHITEGTTFNIFYVKVKILVTPPLDIGILAGITRDFVLDDARQAGLEVRETRFPPERLMEADEIFITSSIREVFPVTRINEKLVGGGVPGPITVLLRNLFRKRIERACAN